MPCIRAVTDFDQWKASRRGRLQKTELAFIGAGSQVEGAMLNDIRIIIHTTRGQLQTILFPAKAPITVANFLNLAVRKYYDGLTFHRVVPKFVIQGGDPLGTGSGDPGYRFQNEIDPSLSHTQVGTLAMANAGPDTNGSQFYVTLAPFPPGQIQALDGNYTIFGRVTDGVEVANAVVRGDKIDRVEVLDSPDAIFESEKNRLQKWNQILDRKFAHKLAPAAVPG